MGSPPEPDPTTIPTTVPTQECPLATTTATARPIAPARSAAVRAGVLAALGTWAVVVLPALVGWVAAPESTQGWFAAVQVANAIWFLGHGQSVGGGGVVVSVTPLLLFLLFVLVAWRWVQRVLLAERIKVRAAEWGPIVARGIIPGYLTGYVSVSAVIALLTLGGPVLPGVAAVPGTLLVPLAALGAALLRPGQGDPPSFVTDLYDRGPRWWPTAWHHGWRAAAVLLAVGLAVVLLLVLVSIGSVLGVHSEYDTNLVAGAVIALAQAFYLGNAATWALAFLAGPGFSVAVGSTISPAAAHPGLMPLVPILAALPDETDYPWPMFVVLAVPVVVGWFLAGWVDDETASDGESTRDRFIALGAGAAVAVAVVTALTALGNGAIGVERLSAIGPSLAPFTGALLAELLVGGAARLGWRVWRGRG